MKAVNTGAKPRSQFHGEYCPGGIHLTTVVGRPLAGWESRGDYPSVSIIVLNYCDAEATIECLRSIASLRYEGPIDIILVENGSRDGSEEKLTVAVASLSLPVQFLCNERNLGFAGGVLSAWPKANGDLVCLLNNDATLHPDCLARLVDGLRGRSDLGAVWPFDAPPTWKEDLKLLDPKESANLRNGTNSLVGNNIWLPLLTDYRECLTASGVCLLLPRRDIDTPFLAEYFAYYEDVYLGWRLRLRGLGAERIPEAVIYHVGSRTSRAQPELRGLLAFHAEKNRLTNLAIFYEVSTLFRVMPLLALDETKKIIVALVRLVTGQNGLDYLSIYGRSRLWLVRHLKWILATRRRVQAERRVNDRTIVRLMSGRLSMQKGIGAVILNLISLSYCRAVGLRTVELSSRSSKMPSVQHAATKS